MTQLAPQAQPASAPLAAIPDHVKALMKPVGSNAYRDDFGELSAQDFGVSFLKIVCQMSKEALPNWDKRGAQPMPVGTMFVSRTHKIIQPGTFFVPLLRKVRYIHWLGKPGQGKMAFTTDNKNDPRITSIHGLDFRDDPENPGKQKAPAVTQYINFYILLQGETEPMILSFYRTGIKKGRAMTQDLHTACHTAHWTLPMLTFMYKIVDPVFEVNEGQQWPVVTTEPAGYTPAEIITKCQAALELAKAMSEASTGAEFQNIDENAGGGNAETEAPENLKPAQPAQVAAPAAPMNVMPLPTAPAAAPVAPPQPPATQKVVW